MIASGSSDGEKPTCNECAELAAPRPGCPECGKLRAKLRRKLYYEKNKARFLAQKREQYRNNPEVFRERNQKNYEKHKAERDAANRRWIAENRERRRRVRRVYLEAHPEYARDSDLRRKARLRASGGNVRRRDRKSFQSATRCIDCLPESTTCAVEIGHMVPVALGGSSRPDNLAPQCADHNTELGVSVHPKAPLRDVAHATIYVARILINPSTLTKREMHIILRALPSIERYWEIWLNE